MHVGHRSMFLKLLLLKVQLTRFSIVFLDTEFYVGSYLLAFTLSLAEIMTIFKNSCIICSCKLDISAGFNSTESELSVALSSKESELPVQAVLIAKANVQKYVADSKPNSK